MKRDTFPKQEHYPKKIHFRRECYRLIFVKNLDCYGVTDAGSKTIKIKKDLSPMQTFKTVLHELLHVVEFEEPMKIKHKMIYKLEEALFDLIMENFL